MNEVVLEVSDFVALANQTFEYAFSGIVIRGELANFRVSKGKWVYFDLKDKQATVRFFGTVYVLPGPLEDGMLVRVRGVPRLHPQYGFSVTASNIQPEGAGAIRQVADLLQRQLTAEGLFDKERKRLLPYPPVSIGLITSSESAAYADFIKVLGARWGGITIECVDVQVQGEVAPAQIVAALAYYNQLALPPEVIVVTRGGGSAEDLYAFSTEQVTRAVAASRIPTIVAIGHEVDISLAELAADQRASTPSNAAELLVPNRHEARRVLQHAERRLHEATLHSLRNQRQSLRHTAEGLNRIVEAVFRHERSRLAAAQQLLHALDPAGVLRRGYAIVRRDGQIVTRVGQAATGTIVNVQVSDGTFDAAVHEESQ